MNKFRLSILLTAFVVFSSNAQTNFQKLKSAIESAPAVVEGKIIRQSSFQDEKTGNIFTKNYLWPTTLFKGIADRDTVIFLTRGGRVGDIISTVSHTVQVSQSQEGIFLLHPSRAISNQYEISSYIERLTYDREFEAYFEGGHEKYPSWRFMREEIGRICGNDVTVERVTSSELLLLDIPEFCVKLANPVLDAINKKVTFDVKAKSNIAGLEFARADIPLKYPQELLGSNIVLNGKVEAAKAESTNTSFYDLNIHDIVDDKFMLTLSSSCNGGESGFVLGTEFEKIAKVTVEVQEYGDLGTINAESFDVDGFAKYFLDGACQEFVEKCVVGQVPLEACIISNIILNPDQVAGGIGQKVEVFGSGFTSSPIVSQMVLPNADDDGFTSFYLSGVSNHFEQGNFWSDTYLKMDISSVVNATTHQSAKNMKIGSGLWEIRPPSSSSFPCSFEVEVDYNLFATWLPSEFRTFGLAQLKTSSPDGKRHWNILTPIDPSLAAQGITFTDLEYIADLVFCEWESKTGIDFEYDGATTVRKPTDGKFTLFYEDVVGTSMTTYVVSPAQLPCNINQKYFGAYIIDGDIGISNTTQWYVNLDESGIISSKKWDLYSALLHEVGHSLGLDHVMDIDPTNSDDDKSLMYYFLDEEHIKRNIDDNSIDGVSWLIDKTEWALSTPGQCFPSPTTDMSIVPLGLSCVNPNLTETVSSDCQITVSSIIAQGDEIKVEMPTNVLSEIVLYNAIGQVFFSSAKVEFLEISTEKFEKGLYFLRTSCGNQSQLHKIIIQ